MSPGGERPFRDPRICEWTFGVEKVSGHTEVRNTAKISRIPAGRRAKFLQAPNGKPPRSRVISRTWDVSGESGPKKAKLPSDPARQAPVISDLLAGRGFDVKDKPKGGAVRTFPSSTAPDRPSASPSARVPWPRGSIFSSSRGSRPILLASCLRPRATSTFPADFFLALLEQAAPGQKESLSSGQRVPGSA